MKRDTKALLLFAALMLVALAWCVVLIVWAHQCGQAGGAFIAPQNSLPVCVQGVRP